MPLRCSTTGPTRCRAWPQHWGWAGVSWLTSSGAARGYPCPKVVELVPDGLVMERIDGVSMLDDVIARPWRVRRHASLLADLHDRLHQLVAPHGLREPFGPGGRKNPRGLHEGWGCPTRRSASPRTTRASCTC